MEEGDPLWCKNDATALVGYADMMMMMMMTFKNSYIMVINNNNKYIFMLPQDHNFTSAVQLKFRSKKFPLAEVERMSTRNAEKRFRQQVSCRKKNFENKTAKKTANRDATHVYYFSRMYLAATAVD